MVNLGNKRAHENQDLSIHLDLAINELSNAKKQREKVELFCCLSVRVRGKDGGVSVLCTECASHHKNTQNIR